MNIYVGNLSYQTSEEEMQDAFGNYGKVTSVAIIKDKFSGQSKGFGFVEMASDTEARAAISALDGTELKGRQIKVNEARPRTERAPDRGGRGPGGGGGGGGRGGSRGGGDRGGGGGGGGRW